MRPLLESATNRSCLVNYAEFPAFYFLRNPDLCYEFFVSLQSAIIEFFGLAVINDYDAARRHIVINARQTFLGRKEKINVQEAKGNRRYTIKIEILKRQPLLSVTSVTLDSFIE